jgi:hypothetical protein
MAIGILLGQRYVLSLPNNEKSGSKRARNSRTVMTQDMQLFLEGRKPPYRYPAAPDPFLRGQFLGIPVGRQVGRQLANWL